MRNKKLLVVAGAILLVGVVFLTATVLADDTEGLYNWYGNTAGQTGFFRNIGTGQALKATTWGNIGVLASSYYSAGDGVFGFTNGTSGWGLRGYASGTSGRGVYAISVNATAVQGVAGTGSGDYGGYFNGFEGVRGIASGSNGYGTWGTASGTSGIGAYGSSTGTSGYGVYGYASNYMGVYGNGDEYGVYGYGDVGVYGQTRLSGSYGVHGKATTSGGMGVRGETSGQGGDGVTASASSTYGYAVDAWTTGVEGYAARFQSAQYRGIFADGSTDGVNNYYDGYFPDHIYVGGTVMNSNGWSVVAQNVGAETLQAGDLVSFVGMDGWMNVEKANGANSGAIVGVVRAAYVMGTSSPIEIVPGVEEGVYEGPALMEKDESPLSTPDHAWPEDLDPGVVEAAPAEPKAVAPEDAGVLPDAGLPNGFEEDTGYVTEGNVEPGGYVIVLIQGFTQVNVGSAVEAGNWLLAASDGSVTAIPERQLSLAERRGDLVIGRALTAAVDGQVWMYVDLR